MGPLSGTPDNRVPVFLGHAMAQKGPAVARRPLNGPKSPDLAPWAPSDGPTLKDCQDEYPYER